MKVQETSLPGCLIIEPTIFSDHRGHFFEGFNTNKFKELTGYDFDVKQMNCSRSAKGVVRGLHFQKPPFEQSKLVFVTKGSVIDVIVDLRPDSTTFGKHCKVLLSNENCRRVFIPKGFAHGFLALEEDTELNYLVDGFYNKAYDAGIIYSDETLQIDWSYEEIDQIILSEKDENLPNLKQYRGE
ncbi:MAG: dTDP-4-dehydrorhamnose 3,5-epimerase [Bacteroidota bacterium]